MAESQAQKEALKRQRFILALFVGLVVLISLGTILGGLSNYQKLYEAGHKDVFGQSIDQHSQAPTPAP